MDAMRRQDTRRSESQGARRRQSDHDPGLAGNFQLLRRPRDPSLCAHYKGGLLKVAARGASSLPWADI